MRQKFPFLLLLAIVFSNTSFGQNFSQLIDKELQRLTHEKQLTESDATWIVTSEHVSRTSGTHHVYFRQLLNGLEINGSESSIHINSDGSVLTKHLNFIDNITQRQQGGIAPGLSAIQAVEAAASQLDYNITENLNVIEKKAGINQETLISKGGISISEIPAKLVYHKLDNGSIKLAWDLSIEHTSKLEWYSLKVDANSGEILNQINWTVSCNLTHDHNEHSHTGHSDHNSYNINTQGDNHEAGALLTGSYRVFAMPIESPYFGTRTLETTAVNTVASPFGWHDTNGVVGPEYTVTRGNNVNAYEDGDNPGFQPDGGASLVFDYPFNPVYSSGDQSEAAAITNLFYWSNVIHDMIYLYGFDEA
ncbi:MAG: extracellular metalloproteinase, partial [Flavobacteriaceae bacterium]|nr:extracellular metalloproteinase [Flavobacteriaceae bacterium]